MFSPHYCSAQHPGPALTFNPRWPSALLVACCPAAAIVTTVSPVSRLIPGQVEVTSAPRGERFPRRAFGIMSARNKGVSVSTAGKLQVKETTMWLEAKHLQGCGWRYWFCPGEEPLQNQDLHQQLVSRTSLSASVTDISRGEIYKRCLMIQIRKPEGTVHAPPTPCWIRTNATPPPLCKHCICAQTHG